MTRTEQLLEEISKKLDVLIALNMPSPAELAQEPGPDPLEDPPEQPRKYRIRVPAFRNSGDLLSLGRIEEVLSRVLDPITHDEIMVYRGLWVEGAEEVQ